MKIVLFGAGGNIGKVILDEALSRGHEVVAIVRDPAKVTPRAHLHIVAGDVAQPATYNDQLHGADAAIASLNGADLPSQASTLLGALDAAGVRRFAWVGGAASLETAPGVRVIDDPNFPAAWKDTAGWQIKALEVFRASHANVDWTFVSPAKELQPGERTGHFRVGGDQVLVDAQGKSHLSVPDLAAGVVDRVEKGDKPRQRVTLAY